VGLCPKGRTLSESRKVGTLNFFRKWESWKVGICGLSGHRIVCFCETEASVWHGIMRGTGIMEQAGIWDCLNKRKKCEEDHAHEKRMNSFLICFWCCQRGQFRCQTSNWRHWTDSTKPKMHEVDSHVWHGLRGNWSDWHEDVGAGVAKDILGRLKFFCSLCSFALPERGMFAI